MNHLFILAVLLLNNRSVLVFYIMDTRDKILDKTFHLLLTKGYDGVSISDIQHATGISRGLLYHYFGNKESLFLEASRDHFTRLFDVDITIAQGFTLEQMCDHLVEKYRELTEQTLQGVSIIDYDFLFYRLMQMHPPMVTIYHRSRENEKHSWRLVLERAQREGVVRVDINVEIMIEQVVYLTDGVWLRAISPADAVNLIDGLKEAFRGFCLLIKSNLS